MWKRERDWALKAGSIFSDGEKRGCSYCDEVNALSICKIPVNKGEWVRMIRFSYP